MYTGEDIKDIRNKLDLLQTEMAEKLGTTVNNIRYWEKTPTAKIKNKYNDVLQVLVESFTFDANKEKVVRDFVTKIKANLAKITFLRDAVAMYRASIDSDVALTNKAVFFAALAYFIMPLDAIPDVIPVLGFTDDAAMIAGAVKSMGSVITDKHRQEAEDFLQGL